MRGFVLLIVSVLIGYGFAANKRPFPSSTEASPPTKQTCFCAHESNSVEGNTSRGGLNERPTDISAVAVGNDAQGSEASVELRSNSFAKAHVASASEEVFKRRRELRQLVVSLSNGRVSDENADIAVEALEESLEADGATSVGHGLLLEVLSGLIDISKNGMRSRTDDTPFKVETWKLSKAGTIPPDHAVWKRIFRGGALDTVLEQRAMAQLEQMIIKIVSEVSSLLTDSGVPACRRDPHLYMDAQFRSLRHAFGLLDSDSPPKSLLRTAQGRLDLERILDLLYSNARLRFQVYAVSQIDREGKNREDVSHSLDFWSGIFYSPEFDDLEAGGASRENARESRKIVLQYRRNRYLAKIPRSTTDALVVDCANDLHALTRAFTEAIELDLQASAEEAIHFLSALMHSFTDFTPSAMDRVGGYVGLYKRVLMALRSQRFQAKVFHIRSLPSSLWFEEWLEFFQNPSVDGIRNALVNQSVSVFLDRAQREEEKKLE